MATSSYLCLQVELLELLTIAWNAHRELVILDSHFCSSMRSSSDMILCVCIKDTSSLLILYMVRARACASSGSAHVFEIFFSFISWCSKYYNGKILFVIDVSTHDQFVWCIVQHIALFPCIVCRKLSTFDSHFRNSLWSSSDVIL